MKETPKSTTTLPKCPACGAQDWTREVQETHTRLDSVYVEDGVLGATIGESLYEEDGPSGDWYCRTCNQTTTREIAEQVQESFSAADPYQL